MASEIDQQLVQRAAFHEPSDRLVQHVSVDGTAVVYEGVDRETFPSKPSFDSASSGSRCSEHRQIPGFVHPNDNGCSRPKRRFCSEAANNKGAQDGSAHGPEEITTSHGGSSLLAHPMALSIF